MDDEHEGTLEQASTGWYYVKCSCGWGTARSLNIDKCWFHHESHQLVEASTRELRRKIHGE